MSKLNWQVRDRVRRWLWRKHARKRSLWNAYPDERLLALRPVDAAGAGGVGTLLKSELNAL